jgi:hypothetical protein
MIAALILFLSTLAEVHNKSIPSSNVVVSLRIAELNGAVKTTCLKDPNGNKSYLIEISLFGLSRTDNEIKHMAVHELCHIMLPEHNKILCSLGGNLDKMEWEADRCAFSLLSK